MIRRTQLKRSTKPLKRTPIRKVGNKRRRELALYAKQAALFKVSHRYCRVRCAPVCGEYTEDVHHVMGRGKYLLVESTWLPVCRNCHNWIHEHPGQARTLNLLQ